MRIEHSASINAPFGRVRMFLDDVERAAHCVPDVSEVHSVGPDAFEGIMRVKLGPLGFNIAGTMTMERRLDGAGWTARGEGRDSRLAAGAKATIDATIIDAGPNSTELTVMADILF